MGFLREAGDMAGSRYAEAFEVTHLALTICPCGCSALALSSSVERCGDNSEGCNGNERRVVEATWVPIEMGRIVLEPCGCGCLALAVGRNSRREATLTLSRPIEAGESRCRPSNAEGHIDRAGR